MTDDGPPEEFESIHAASDDELADHLAFDDALENDGTGDHQPASPSPAPPADGPRHSHRRSASPNDNLRTPAEPTPADSATGPVASEPRRRALGRRDRRKGKKRKKAPWWELPALALFAVLIAILVKTFVVQPFYIPSQSMEKTLHGCPGCSGDRILVNKPIYDLRDPHPGDIVVFHAPDGWDDEPAVKVPSNPIAKAVRGFGQLVGFVPPDDLVLVKRVIAVGGQTVKGDASGHVLISQNGDAGPWRTLNEPYVYEDGTDSHAQFGPVTVPPGRLWVMGDHRNDSADSRFHCDASGSGSNDGPDCDAKSATVPISKVIGKAAVIAWPPSRWRTLGTPSTFEHAALATGGAVPAAGSMALTLPLWFVRRRRRRRPRS
ncbi:MAG: signal peptidase I [Jatrophihabitantaceae bacterium]